MTICDFDFLKNTFDEFFDDPIIKKKIKEIANLKKWGGFERWWQIELAIFLERKEKKKEICKYSREDFAYLKQHGNLKKIRKHFDFRIKRNTARKYLCLEIKSVKDFNKCFSELGNDFELYQKSRGQYIKSDKNIYLAGICNPASGRKKHDEVSIENAIRKLYDIDKVHISKIGRTGLIFFLF